MVLVCFINIKRLVLLFISSMLINIFIESLDPRDEDTQLSSVYLVVAIVGFFILAFILVVLILAIRKQQVIHSLNPHILGMVCSLGLTFSNKYNGV